LCPAKNTHGAHDWTRFDPAEDGRADDDPRNEFKRDGRNPRAWEETEDEGDKERDRRNAKQVDEREVHGELNHSIGLGGSERRLL